MKPVIIAEIGINHNGDIPTAKLMILSAKNMGADVAKFQLYDPEVLLNKDDFSRRDWEIIKQAKLEKDQVWELSEYCKDVGIEFMASAFDDERLGWLEHLNVKRHKIAARTMEHTEYVKKVINTGKPIIASTSSFYASIGGAYIALAQCRQKVSFLYCVSNYPTELKELEFYQLMFSKNEEGWNDYDGFSDHTIGTAAAMVAISLGATIIEKHFTFNRMADGPDHKCSMTPGELLDICNFRDRFSEMRVYESF